MDEKSDEDVDCSPSERHGQHHPAHTQGKWRAGKKQRRVLVGEEGEDAEQPPKDDHPDTALDPQLLALLDALDRDIPEELRDQVYELRREIQSRRQVRPYADLVRYGATRAHKRVRNRHRGRLPLKNRSVCLGTYDMLLRKL